MATFEGASCEYLYHQALRLERHVCSAHRHPFWQLEAVYEGEERAVVAGRTHRLRPGTALLIPPRSLHSFDSDGRPCAFHSVKFRAGEHVRPPPGGVLLAGPVHSRLVEAVHALMNARGSPTPAWRAALGQVLSAIVTLATAGEQEEEDDDLVARVQRYVAYNATWSLSVAEVASAFGYSTRHLSSLVHAATGRPLKRLIDEARADHACRLLDYADASITEVAEQLGFPDVYAFSRFFRRVEGHSPSAHREAGRPPRRVSEDRDPGPALEGRSGDEPTEADDALHRVPDAALERRAAVDRADGEARRSRET